MQKSIELLVKALEKDIAKYNEVVSYLFTLFERHGLFECSEHLAKIIKDNNTCYHDETVKTNLSKFKQLSSGETAPEIYFEGDINKNPTGVNRLSLINTDFILIVFGASWCMLCQEELSMIKSRYTAWQEKGLSVMFVSLDIDSHSYFSFIKEFTFPSFCDYKKWQNRAVRDYNVYATPTLYLVDRNRKVILKAKNVNQINEWVLKL